MKQIYLLFAFLILFSCAKTPGKYALEKSKDFKPSEELHEPLFFEPYDLMMFPVEKNYIIRSGQKKIIVLNSRSGLGSSMPSYTDNGVVNYKWREIKNRDGKFKSMFKDDLVVLNRLAVSEVYGSGGEELQPFMVFLLVENDTDNNGIIDDEKDMRSLYVFSFITRTLLKISPDDMSVNTYKPEIRFVKKIAERNDENKQKPANYIIYFSGHKSGKADDERYIYHLDGNFLEKIEVSPM